MNRGSLWRRWDLHCHTASSYDYAYKADDSDEILVGEFKKNEIVAVAITDHFIIDVDRIEKLRQLAPDIIFFPGVELRTDKGDTNIHVILIFDINLNLYELVEAFNVFKREKAKNNNNNDIIYWDYSEISKFAKEHKAIITIHAGSKSNGVDQRITSRLEINQAVKEEYANTVDIFEMGKLKDLNDYRNNVFPTIGERPMVICSDNHDPRSYNPSEKLWIKADVTFNGLKQIIYEPNERICLSSTKPEEKPDYLVIERIEIKDKDFQDEPIYLNDKLTCIIGGKSTGKSILLHNLALALDKTQTEKRDETSKTSTKKDVEFSVFWADGVCGNPENSKKIVYVPQTYLNKLCDEQTEKTEIDKLIEDIILTDTESKKAFDKMTSSIKAYRLELTKKISDLLEAHNSIIELNEKMKELGDRKGIVKEREKLIAEKQRLSSEMSLDDNDITDYEEAVAKIGSLVKEISFIKDEILALSDVKTLVESIAFKNSFSDSVKEKIISVQSEIIKEANQKWDLVRKELINALNVLEESKRRDLIEAQKIEAPLKAKMQSNKAIAELTERIKNETDKLSEFEKLEKSKTEEETQKSELLIAVVNSVDFFKEQHKIFSAVVNNNFSLNPHDLSFSVAEPFRKDSFIDKLKNIMDVRREAFKKNISPDDFTEEKYTKENIKGIIEKILSGELHLLKNVTFESALREILEDWYETKYKVTMGEDSIDVMSPGKKALVLLKLLIELAESHCPILIDQPEDDLDNRSVFDELIPFIKRKKKERQIIIVTHNANIVIGADSDEVIIANQRGKNAPNKEKRFEYKTGAIEDDIDLPLGERSPEKGILNWQGVQQHIRDILEGGKEAFRKRIQKYHMQATD